MFLQTERVIIKPFLTPHYSPENSIYYYLYEKEELEEIGYICFQNIDFKKGTADLAYKTYSNFRKQGYMKEVLPILVEESFIFLPLITIFIEIKDTNIASLNTIKHIHGIKEKLTIPYKKSLDYVYFYKRKGE